MKPIARLLVLTLALSTSACLEFEEQTMSYRYGKATDELRIFQDYRGIFGADAQGDAGVALSDDEAEQLESVLGGRRTFFFGNWIFEYDGEALETLRESVSNPETSKVAAPDRPKLVRLLDLALKNVDIANGPFYVDGDGKLCGVQSVAVKDFSKIVAAVNECAPIFFQQVKEDEDVSPADLAAIAKFEKDPEAKLLWHDGNALRLTWPMSRATYDENLGTRSNDPKRMDEVRAAGIGIKFADDVATFSVGRAADEITSVTLDFSKVAYTPNALTAVRTKRKVKDGNDTAAAAKTFLLSTPAADQ